LLIFKNKNLFNMSFSSIRNVFNSCSSKAYNCCAFACNYVTSSASKLERITQVLRRVAFSTFEGSLNGMFKGPLFGYPLHLYNQSSAFQEIAKKIVLVSGASLCASDGIIVPVVAFFSSFANEAAKSELSNEVILYTIDYLFKDAPLNLMKGAIFGGTLSCIQTLVDEIFSNKNENRERVVSVAARGIAGSASSLVSQNLGMAVLSAGTKSMSAFVASKLSINALIAKLKPELQQLNLKNITHDCIFSFFMFVIFQHFYETYSIY
jgi:hypothetical protein